MNFSQLRLPGLIVIQLNPHISNSQRKQNIVQDGGGFEMANNK